MSIEHSTTSATQASNQGQSTQVQWQFFGPTSVENESHTFEVNQQPVYIEGYNFEDDDTVTVQMVSGEFYADYRPIRGLVQLTAVRTKLRIDYPGIYRLVFSGGNVADVTVVGFPGTMTHDSTTELAEALAAIITAQGIFPAPGNNKEVLYNNAGVIDALPSLQMDPALSGRVGIGDAPTSQVTLYGHGTVTDNDGDYIFVKDQTSILDGGAYRSFVSIPAFGPGLTPSTIKGFDAQNVGVGLGSTLLAQVGFFADDFTRSAINTSFLSNQSKGEFNYAFFCGGEAASLFGAQGIILRPLAAGTPDFTPDGKIWYDDTNDTLRVRLNGVTKTVTVS